VYEYLILQSITSWKPLLYDKMTFVLQVGLSSKNADIDNCIKAFVDILQKKYLFNDSRVYRIEAQKEIVTKGAEYIDVEILPFLD